MLRSLLAIFLIVSCSSRDDSSDPMPTIPGGNPPSQNPIPGGGGGGNIVEREQYLTFHNLKRCWHGTQVIKWSEKLAASAYAHANRCTYANDPNTTEGENIAVGSGLGIIKAQDDWYMEGIFFPFGDKDAPAEMRRFAQVVWGASTNLGCAHASCPKGDVYVCRYSPAGNQTGEADKNVFKLVPDFLSCTGMQRF